MEKKTKYTIVIAKNDSPAFRQLIKVREVDTLKGNYYAFLERLFRKLANGEYIENVDFHINVSERQITESEKAEYINGFITIINIRANGDKTSDEIEDKINKLLDSVIWRK